MTRIKLHARARQLWHGLMLCALMGALLGTEAHSGRAQTLDTGTIRGHVADQTGASVVGAEVTATNELTGLSRDARTDDGGNYTLAGLPLTGRYKVTVTSAGFAPREVSDVELRAGAAATLDATLSPAQVRIEDVTVLGTTDAVQSDTAQLSTRLDLQKIEETPVFGRKITNLVQLNSAVRPARGTGDLFLNNFLFVVNGSGRRQTTVQIDGSNGDDSWGRQSLFTNVPLAALQEFTILTNGVSAEYGRTTGSAVNIVTKTGTNEFHTDLIGVARPGGLQARVPGAARRTIDRLGQFSGILSGPLKQDRTHFLAGAEVNIQRRDA
ncbi:MAG TPA: carboxypeptidase regulatory-like domain-containing protein, partial [Pyrinomonadaceae bacterium]|nr:carboxypeptidase regulatory-like domain-containing protein [Pyrinomonadaceae bacterium]